MKKSVKKALKIALVIISTLLIVIGVIGVRAYIEIGHTPNEKDFARYEELSYFKNGQFIPPEEQPIYLDRVSGGSFSWFRFLFAG
jgi:hypothetical protein